MKAIFYQDDSPTLWILSKIAEKNGINSNFKSTNEIETLENEIFKFKPNFVVLHAHTLPESIENPYTKSGDYNYKVLKEGWISISNCNGYYKVDYRDFDRIKQLTKKIRIELPKCYIIIGHHHNVNTNYINMLHQEYESDLIIDESSFFIDFQSVLNVIIQKI